MTAHNHWLCGWHVRSALALPELPAWHGPAEAAPDVEILAGPVAPAGAGVDPDLCVAQDGAVLFDLPGVVRLRVEAGRRVTVDVDPQGGDDWRVFLLGLCPGYLCHQRGEFALHAAATEVAGGALVFAGESGAGKSTLADALVRRGHRLMSDDIAVLRVEGDSVLTMPAVPRLLLWSDSLAAGGRTADGLPRLRPMLEKFALMPAVVFDPAPKRVAAIMVLDTGAAPALEPLAAGAAAASLHHEVARPFVGRQLGRDFALLRDAAAIARRVPVYRLTRTKDFDDLPAVIARIEAVAA